MLTDEDGLILETGSGTPPGEAIHLNGILTPGFVNAHCHVELSFLRGRIPEKAGMTGFIRQLLQLRNTTSAADQQKGIQEACTEMLQNGIVAVGDIANTTNTAAYKKYSTLQFHTFDEVLGFNEEKASSIVKNALEMLPEFVHNQNTSDLTLHAPYSISQSLTRLVVNRLQQTGSPFTIHLEESKDELEFCKTGTGPMAEFFKAAGLDFSRFSFHTETPLKHLLPEFAGLKNVIFVHNTYITEQEIQWAEKLHRNIFWCLCPKANLYITGKLPPLEAIYHNAKNIVVGTDSLASNDSLDILSELSVLADAYPSIPFHEMIKWATLNGAKALQFENTFGSIETGKKPGLLLLENIHPGNPVFTRNTSVRRVI